MPNAPPSDGSPSKLAQLYAPGPQQHDPETIRYVIRRMAEEFGEKPETILAEIDHDPITPAGRFILKLMRFATPEVRRGRPANGTTPKTLARDEAVYRIVEELCDGGLSPSEAFSRAPSRLARPDIKIGGRDKALVNRKTVKRAYERHREALLVRMWFEPPTD